MFEIINYLASKGIETKNCFDDGIYYLDLETKAKSHLYLYADGTLKGRYSYETKLDLSKPIDEVAKDLCNEFNDALHGRNYGQQGWFDLCRELGINVETFC